MSLPGAIRDQGVISVHETPAAHATTHATPGCKPTPILAYWIASHPAIIAETCNKTATIMKTTYMTFSFRKDSENVSAP